MPAWISATISIERRIRRQRVADQRDIDAMRHRPFGEQREGLLGAVLPVAAVNEQQRRRVVGGLEEVDPVALARAIAEIEMIGIARAHLARTPIPAGDDVGASGHRHAVVEAEVAVLPGSCCASPGASNGVVMLKISESRANFGPFPLCRKMFYRTTAIRYRDSGTTRERYKWLDQGLVRATACAIVDKLNSGEVTPLDLLDVLEKRIAEVDGKVNALPTLCFDRARSRAKALMQKPAGERGLLAGHAGADQGPHQCRGRADHAGLADLQGHDSRALRSCGRASRRQRRGGLRQIQHAGIRRRRQHLQ